MAEKGREFPLSITIRTIDRATSGLKRVNERLEQMFKPFRDLRKELATLHENLGLPKLAAGFRGIGGMARQLGSHIGFVGGLAITAARGFKAIVDSADQLGDTAEKVGLSVDALAQLRDAAQRAGSSQEELDAGMVTFSRSLGQVRAGTGRLTSFLARVSPALLRQVKAAKSNEEAFGLMADAMAKVEDPAKRTALATAAFGGAGAGLAPLLARGSNGIAELRQRYAELAGPQKQAVDEAGRVDEAFHDLRGATDSVKSALVIGLGPAFRDLTARVTEFLTSHREQITTWLKDFGEKLPGRIQTVIDVFSKLLGAIKSMVDLVGGAGNAVKLLVIAWASFKALELVSHLAGVTRGLYGVAKAAVAARAVQGAAGAAAGGGKAAIAGNAIAGGTAGRMALGARGGLIGLGIAGIWSLYSWSKDRDEATLAKARERGAVVNDTLRQVREQKDPYVRRDMIRSLGKSGFLTKSGKVNESTENWSALSDGKLFESGFMDFRAKQEAKKKIDEINRILDETRNLEGPAPLPQDQIPQAQISVSFENAPPGMRVTTDPQNTADVDVSTGYQMAMP